ncbi:MAG: class I mannose-6-phosphate isomerase [Sphingosinicella sp.]|uniref:class I mannose-6-phosphate isomerase n=1 Tax=Sphingosinicella sp. TaxID=1917971 RepID=UPI00403813A5
MNSRRLEHRYEERVWGRDALPNWAETQPSTGAPIGEIWFVEDEDCPAELLVKYLFTSERLSIQVHPDDKGARAIGFPRGKDEAWLVLDAEPDAVIGIGLKEVASKETLRAAALDGSIEELIDWRPVRAGDFFYSPSGTVHAIGPGLSLVEIQQNLDVTYRLYDYGRPRELHLDAGIAAADPVPWQRSFVPRETGPGREILHAGGNFVVERWTFSGEAEVESADGQLVLVPLSAEGELDCQSLEPGSVWRVDGMANLASAAPLDLLAAYPGADVRETLLQR